MFLWSLLACFICVHGECIFKLLVLVILLLIHAFCKCIDESLGYLEYLFAFMLSRILCSRIYEQAVKNYGNKNQINSGNKNKTIPEDEYFLFKTF